MANNCTVFLMQQNQDGTIQGEIFHWADRPEGETVPPNGEIRPVLARKLPTENKFSLNKKAHFATRSAAVTAITAFLNTAYPDTLP